MRRNYSYFLSLLPGIVTVFGNLQGGNWVFTNLIFTLGILPVVELFVPQNKSNEIDEAAFIPDLVLVLQLMMQTIALSSFIYIVKGNSLTGFQLLGAVLSTGIHTGTCGIVVAHEMIHRKNAGWQWGGKYLLFTAANVYFFVEHLRVHHKWVGTERDPATARKDESVYAFFLRSVYGQFLGAWKMEADRMKQEGRSVLHPSNYVFRNIVLQLAFLAILTFIFGYPVALLFLAQAFVANFLLEYTTYIEHYGLSRPENVRVQEDLSWQTDKVVSRILLIELSRHSDHHFYASKPYHKLESLAKSPVLPGGYASAFYMAIIPPLWFKIVNKSLENYLKANPQNSRIAL